MKVKDLIEKLKTLPAEEQVLVQGYEDGFDAIVAVKEIAVVKKTNAADYSGEYEEAAKKDQNTTRTTVIFGNRR